MGKYKKDKMLDGDFDYYKNIKKISDQFSKKYFKEYNEFLNGQLYNLILNICNQVVYDYQYIFNKEELYLLADYKININDILIACRPDIIKMKLREEDEASAL